MFAKTTEEKFLKAWAHEEFNQLAGEAHRLQDAHEVESTELAARFRAWAIVRGWTCWPFRRCWTFPSRAPLTGPGPKRRVENFWIL